MLPRLNAMTSMTDDRPQRCPICDGQRRNTCKDWLFKCSNCGFLQSTLKSKIQSLPPQETTINETKRAVALNKLRTANFERVLDRLIKIDEIQRKRLLDVGCAHGWFLKAGIARGYETIGLEPDPNISTLATHQGYRVWNGFFPEDIPAGEQFDVIVFNDVFEHLSDVKRAIRACYRLLTRHGILVINLPSSKGIFYRIARALDFVGISGPFERMWQHKFASPHVSYFDPDQLCHLAERCGFIEVHRSVLPSIEIDGLWSRLSYDRSASKAFSVLVWFSVVLALPLIEILPADISLQIFRREA